MRLVKAALLFFLLVPPATAQMLPQVADNAALQALPSRQFPVVERLGFITVGDGGAARYRSSTAACPLNGGNGDNGLQVRARDNGCWIADFSAAAPNVMVWGARCDGTTDDAAAINAALSSGVPVVSFPSGRNCYAASTITVPNSAQLVSQGFVPSTYYAGGNMTQGTRLTTGVTSGPAVVLDGGAGYGSPRISGLTITRNGTTIPPGSVCLRVTNANQPTVDETMCDMFAQGYVFTTGGHLSMGGVAMRIYTGRISDAHFVYDGWAQLYVTQASFGGRGTGRGCNAYIRITGGQSGNQPNTLTWTDSQFNIGDISQGECNSWLQFQNMTEPSIDWGGFKFSGLHVEQIHNGISGDSTVSVVRHFQLTDSQIWSTANNDPNNHFLNLAPNTGLLDFHMSDDGLAFYDFSVYSTGVLRGLFIHHTFLNGTNMNVTAATGQAYGVNYTDNYSEQAGLALGGAFQSGRFSGTTLNGVIANTMTPGSRAQVDYTGTQGSFAWTPNLTFGGNAAGMSIASRSGLWQIQGDTLTASFYIQLSARGSSTGAAAISGLPLPCRQSGTFATNYVNLVGIAGNAVFVTPSTDGSGNASIYQGSATALTPLGENNFANNSIITGTIHCVAY